MNAASVAVLLWAASCAAGAGQVPGAMERPDVPISPADRVYIAEQYSNTVSVVDPSSGVHLGVIRLGDPAPEHLSPLYRGQALVHGLGFSPDHRTIAVVSVGSNAVSFIDTRTNTVKHTTYVGRSPHEVFYSQDGTEVWVTIRGEDYVAVLDAATYQQVRRIPTPPGPGMQIFSPDGRYAYICSSFTPETVVVSMATHEIVGRVQQESPFCPNIAASPDGRQVWMTLKDVGRTMVFNARPPFQVLRTLETGPLTNHVNFVAKREGVIAYITVGGLNEVKAYRTSDFSLLGTIKVGKLPHGIWPSGDGRRIYVGLEAADSLTVIDTRTNEIVADIPVGQAPQALAYVSGAVTGGTGRQGLAPLGPAGLAAHVELRPVSAPGRMAGAPAPTSVALYEQGLVQVLEAAVTGLAPMARYTLALAERPDGGGNRVALASFTANPAGAAVVSAIGPIRQLARPEVGGERRYLVITTTHGRGEPEVVQVQTD